VLVVSSDRFNGSRIRTVVVAALTTSARAVQAPGNVGIAAGTAGLDRDCTVNISQLLTFDKADLEPALGQLGPAALRSVDAGLRLVLGLDQP
jgi:mRNA interferase MazF